MEQPRRTADLRTHGGFVGRGPARCLRARQRRRAVAYRLRQWRLARVAAVRGWSIVRSRGRLVGSKPPRCFRGRARPGDVAPVVGRRCLERVGANRWDPYVESLCRLVGDGPRRRGRAWQRWTALAPMVGRSRVGLATYGRPDGLRHRSVDNSRPGFPASDEPGLRNGRAANGPLVPGLRLHAGAALRAGKPGYSATRRGRRGHPAVG